MLLIFSGLPTTGKSGLENFPEPSWEDVQRRRLEYTAWVEPILTVDAVESCEAYVNRVLGWLEHGVRQTESQ
jgi:hypothetical protein